MLDFLNHDNFDPSMNETYIALIPKIKNLSRISRSVDPLAFVIFFTSS